MTEFRFGFLINAIAFTAAGIAAFLIGFALLEKMAPFSVWKEVREEKNVAVAILFGSLGVALALIVAATMH